MSKVALVTGATSGIGQEVVRVFAEHGWRVMATGRKQAQGDKPVAELGADLCAFRAADLCETGVADWLVEGHCHGNWMSSA